MRVAVNTRFLLKDQLEGIGLFTHEVLRRVVKNHPEDEFIFCFDRPHKSQFLYGPNVTPVHVFPPARHPALFYAWFEWAIPRIFRRYDPDIFFSPDGFCSLYAGAPATLLTIHDLSYLHLPDHLPKRMRKYYEYYMPQFIRKAQRIVTVSNYSKVDIIESFSVDENKISVCPNGCREIFHPLNDAEKENTRNKFSGGKPYFLYVGAIQPRKNLERLIESFNYFKTKTRAPHKLILAGRKAWSTSSLTQRAEASPYKEDIIFPGYVRDAEINYLMGSCLSFVYISLWEGFGMPILEAMQCDVPVIASGTSALSETGGDAVLYVDPMSAHSIGEGMEKIWKDEQLAKTLIEKGRKQRNQFDWETSSSCIYDQMESVASG